MLHVSNLIVLGSTSLAPASGLMFSYELKDSFCLGERGSLPIPVVTEIQWPVRESKSPFLSTVDVKRIHDTLLQAHHTYSCNNSYLLTPWSKISYW